MAGLSTQELTNIRETLAAGKRPRVMFTEAAGQIAGQIGHVVHLDDPEQDEWIMVKFGSDTLPFSPADLLIPARGATGKPAAAAKAAAAKQAAPEPAAPEPEFMVVRETPAAIARQEKQEKKSVSTEESTTTPAPAPRKPAAKGKTKAPAGLTVTLSYTEGEWTVGAVQGSKALAKPYVIKPAEALKMVSLLDVPGVHEAVEQILSAERSEAKAQAERLRAELAELEAKLAELG